MDGSVNLTSLTFADGTTQNTAAGAASTGGVYYPAAYGVKGDGVTDDTAAFQSLINAVPDYSEIHLPAGTKIKLTSSVSISNRQGLKMVGLQSLGAQAAGFGSSAIQFIWAGAAGGTVFSLNRVYGCWFEGFSILLQNGSGQPAANVALDIDQSATGSNICTDNRYVRIYVWNSNANSSLEAFRVSKTSPSNCEQQIFTSCSVLGAAVSGQNNGIGLSIYSANAKNIVLQDSVLSQCGVGVQVNGGSDISVLRNLMDNNYTDLNVVNAAGVLRYCGNRSEGASAPVTTAASAALLGLIVEGNEFAAPVNSSTTISIGADGMGPLTLIGNVWDQNNTVVPLNGGSTNCSVISLGNIFPNATVNWSSFTQGATSLNDIYRTPAGFGGVLPPMLGSSIATGATAGTNGAVPSQVAGYLTISINGTHYKVPYFNT